MVRKTKEEAFATRGRILDAAELLFQQHGVSATSLHHIAQQAGVTRGAVYWHFKDKADLFEGLLARVHLPIETASAASLERLDDTPPLERLREHVAALFNCIAGDPQVRRIFDIITTRVEYVDETSALRERKAAAVRGYLERLQPVLQAAQDAGHIAAHPPPRVLAIGLFALVDGLIRNWVLDPEAYALPSTGLQIVEHHLACLALGAPAGTAPPRRGRAS